MNGFRSGTGVILLAMAATLLPMASAGAATVDFEDIGVPPGGNVLSQDFHSRGYLLHSTEHLHLINNLSPTISWNDSSWLGVHDDVENQVLLSRENGGEFSLVSVQVSEFFGAPNGTQVLATGTRTNGPAVTLLFSLDDVADGPGPLDDFQTVVFGSSWSHLTSVNFNAVAGGGARWYALDNFVTVEAPPVPEPATWMILAGGLGMLGAVRHARGGRRT